jgi:hypothetical protein
MNTPLRYLQRHRHRHRHRPHRALARRDATSAVYSLRRQVRQEKETPWDGSATDT